MIRRVAVLLKKEFVFGSRNYIFIFALVLPIVLSLVMGLLFGTLLSELPRLAITDQGDSQVAEALLASDFMAVIEYETQEDLMRATEDGVVDIGLVLPESIDATLQSGRTELTFYTWGQSLVRDRATINAAVTETLVELTGRETPVTVNVSLLGDQEALPWQDRLLPLVVLMSVVIGGVMVPATSMVQEQEKKTLRALTTSPMSLAEIFLTKGMVGVILSIFSGLLILGLNGGWGPRPDLLVLLLVLSAIFSSAFGVILGSLIKDQQTLFATIKALGLLLYAPGLLGLFPEVVPDWVLRVFPTYYIMQPLIDISQNGAGLGDISFDLIVLIVMTLLMMGGLAFSANRLQVQAT